MYTSIVAFIIPSITERLLLISLLSIFWLAAGSSASKDSSKIFERYLSFQNERLVSIIWDSIWVRVYTCGLKCGGVWCRYTPSIDTYGLVTRSKAGLPASLPLRLELSPSVNKRKKLASISYKVLKSFLNRCYVLKIVWLTFSKNNRICQPWINFGMEIGESGIVMGENVASIGGLEGHRYLASKWEWTERINQIYRYCGMPSSSSSLAEKVSRVWNLNWNW